MQLVLDTAHVTLSKKNGVFHVEGEKGARSIGPGKISSIAVTATVTIVSDAIILAVENGIPILFFDRMGKSKARMWSPYFESIATLRRQQVHFAESPEATAWMIDLFELKGKGQADNLSSLQKRQTGLGMGLSNAVTSIRANSRNLEAFRSSVISQCRQNMMGVEGSIARVYWQALGEALPREFRFKQRSRQPAKDVFNAAINYLYGMLYTIVEGGVFAAGLDPHLGFLHADEHNKPTLVYDLIEPFRPWADDLLAQQCFANKVESRFFTQNQYGIFLNKEGKAFFIPLFNDFLRSSRSFLGQESTVKNHIYFMAGRLAQRIRATAE